MWQPRTLIGPLESMTSADTDIMRSLSRRLAVWTRAFLARSREAASQHEALEARIQGLSRSNTELSKEIAKWVRVEAELRKSAELVMLLLEFAPEAIYGIDLRVDALFVTPPASA